MAIPRRGDIWTADLPDYGFRPAVILTRDEAIPHLTRVTVAPVTRTIRNIETEVPLMPSERKVREPCVVSCDNIVTVDQSCLAEKMTQLDLDTMNAVASAIHVALDLEW